MLAKNAIRDPNSCYLTQSRCYLTFFAIWEKKCDLRFYLTTIKKEQLWRHIPYRYNGLARFLKNKIFKKYKIVIIIRDWLAFLAKEFESLFFLKTFLKVKSQIAVSNFLFWITRENRSMIFEIARALKKRWIANRSLKSHWIIERLKEQNFWYNTMLPSSLETWKVFVFLVWKFLTKILARNHGYLAVLLNRLDLRELQFHVSFYGQYH